MRLTSIARNTAIDLLTCSFANLEDVLAVLLKNSYWPPKVESSIGHVVDAISLWTGKIQEHPMLRRRNSVTPTTKRLHTAESEVLVART
jgi:hypothetical protein